MNAFNRHVSLLALFVLVCFAGCGGKKSDSTAASIPGVAKEDAKPLTDAAKAPTVLLETTYGKITVRLDEQSAPNTVRNFVSYVEAGFYDGTLVHQAFANQGFVAGVYDERFQPKEAQRSIRNESQISGLKNRRKTITMVRHPDYPDSASCEFMINVNDNTEFDYRDPTPQGSGYCAFGEVIDGMDVVDKIASTPTVDDDKKCDSTPRETIVIKSAKLLK